VKINDANQKLKNCPECGSKRVFHDGFRPAPLNASSNRPIPRYRCAEYGHRFSQHLKVKHADKKNSRISVILQDAKNLAPTQELKTCAEMERTPTENEIRATPQIEKLLTQLKNDGRKAVTLVNYRKALRVLLRSGADLFDPEGTKAVLAKLSMKDSSKHTIVTMLEVWFEFNEISWKAPKYSSDYEAPYLPTEAELDQFIACLGKKTGTFCQLLKDTGARCGEISALKWHDIDFGQHRVRIKAEKGSNSRVLPLSAKTIDMLCNLPRNTERLFAGCSGLRSNFFLQRRRKAQQKANPNFLRIHFHTFRHWKATEEQHKTKDPWHVKLILGHKSIQSTERYIHLEKMLYEGTNNDQFTVKVADTLEAAVKLMEVGYEYHATVEGHQLFRKRN
jgi:integrase